MQDREERNTFDMIVVGGAPSQGLTGIVSAARYLQAHPSSRLAILEQDYCLGGVWSKRRIFSNFWSQSAYGISEFADMPMTQPPPEDCKYDLFKAEHTMRYLEGYVDSIRIDGRSLRDRIMLKTRVQSVERVANRWHVLCDVPTDKKFTQTFITTRLMIANGQASLPNMPNLPGKEEFRGIILHSIDFGQSDVISNEKIHHVAVLGGGKSSADMVYEAVKAGKTVSWIIRPNGPHSTGPGFFAPPDVQTPYQNPGFAAQTRIMSTLQPTFMNPDNWWTRFLHSTGMGARLVGWIFDKADAQIRSRAAYKERKSSKGFEKLEYETGIFWQNGTGGVHHHDDFYSLVAEKVTVYRASIQKLSENELYLDDEARTHFPCDALLCGTGWRRELEMFSTDLKIRLGLPYVKELESPEIRTKWEKLVEEEDSKVLEKFVILRNPPPHSHVNETLTPYRLYKGMAPLDDDSILFMNHITLANKLFGAEAQAMWAVAYFDHKIDLPSVEEREREIATWIAWCRRRHLSNGELANFVAFDGVPYVDGLLAQMGVTAHRRKGWMGNLFAPVMPADLGKAWSEYLEINSK